MDNNDAESAHIHLGSVQSLCLLSIVVRFKSVQPFPPPLGKNNSMSVKLSRLSLPVSHKLQFSGLFGHGIKASYSTAPAALIFSVLSTLYQQLVSQTNDGGGSYILQPRRKCGEAERANMRTFSSSYMRLL